MALGLSLGLVERPARQTQTELVTSVVLGRMHSACSVAQEARSLWIRGAVGYQCRIGEKACFLEVQHISQLYLGGGFFPFFPPSIVIL